METVSLVASVVSVIIGSFAIWLSVTFYRLSYKISEDTKEASKGILASVDRLEGLFDRLYSDTFSMMKDTVSDMRKHIWPEKEQNTEELETIEAKADRKVDKLRSDIASEISTLIHQVGQADTKIAGVEDRLTGLIDRAITQSRRVESEAQEEISMADVRSDIMSMVQRYGKVSIRKLLLRHPIFRRHYSPSLVREGLLSLIRHNIIEVSGDIDDVNCTVSMPLQYYDDEVQQESIPYQSHP